MDRISWTIAGRKVELIKEDDQFNPQVGLQKARKFVESDDVDMILGPQASNVAMAIINFVEQTKTYLVVSGAGTNDIGWQHKPYLFRTSLSSWQLVHPIGEWVYDEISKYGGDRCRRRCRRPRYSRCVQPRLCEKRGQCPKGSLHAARYDGFQSLPHRHPFAQGGCSLCLSPGREAI